MSKRLLIINSVLGFGSTGNIVLNIAREYQQNGYEVKAAYGRNFKVSKDKLPDIKKYGIRIGNDIDVYSHLIYSRLTDKHGFASKAATKKFLKWAEEYDPDILWLHNIHGYYINYELLFAWIKSRPQMQVKWTLHDCWAFTGHCSHFTYVGCDKWQTGCENCPQLDQYPKAIIDNSVDNYSRKKKAFTGVPNLTIVTPSNWLKEKVKQSFLSEYPVEVHYNTINTEIFKPTPSTFKQDHGIQDKKMILGVASIWNERKGLNDFIELARLLDEKNKMYGQYKIVLVGLSDSQIKDLSKKAPNILAFPRTSSAKELAEIYSAADVFVNPSYEETYGLTVAEAQACGCYSVVYDNTACSEIISRDNGEIINHGARYIESAIYRKYEYEGFKKIYLDYNVLNVIVNDTRMMKEVLSIKKRLPVRFFISVAHLEELFRAEKGENDSKTGVTKKLEIGIREIVEPYVWSPDFTGMSLDSYEAAKKRVRKTDTTKAVSDLSEVGYECQKKYKNNPAKLFEGISHTPEDEYIKVWSVPKIKARLISQDVWGKYSSLKNDYCKLEEYITMLMNILTSEGYKRENSVRKYKSATYDTQHSICASSCDVFITCDEKFAAKYKAVAYYLGIPIKVLLFNGSIDSIIDSLFDVV